MKNKIEKEIKIIKDKLLILERERTQDICENMKLTLDVIWPTLIDYAIKNITSKGFNQETIQIYDKLYEIFYKLSKKFLKIKKNLLYSCISPFIDENIVKNEDIKEWLNIKDELIKRLKKKNHIQNIIKQ